MALRNNPFYNAVRDQYFGHPLGAMGQSAQAQRWGDVTAAEIQVRLREFERQQEAMAQSKAASGSAAREDEARRQRQLLLLIC